MNTQLKIIFGLQAFGAFILMMVVIYFLFDLSLLSSAGIAAFAAAGISFWGVYKYKRFAEKKRTND